MAQQKQPVTLDEQTTRAMVGHYKAAQSWGLKAIVLTALGQDWHPLGSEIVGDALASQQPRLRVFAVEALQRCRASHLKLVATRRIVGQLVTHGLVDKTGYYKSRVLGLLKRIAPFVDSRDEASLVRWWKQVGQTYQAQRRAQPEKPEEKPRKGGSVEVAYRKQQVRYVTRARMLARVGLDVVICIDSTGSMQPIIDATRTAVGEIISILRGISPTFKLGLVHYKDEAVFENGAQTLLKLTPELSKVRIVLGRLRASGGGGRPESIEKGLWYALDKSIGWRRDSIKSVIVIGDAPCYQNKLTELLNMAGQAHRGPWKTWTDTTTPFVISTICAGNAADTKHVFQEVARRGGGVFQQVARGKRRDDTIVKHMFSVTFGSRWTAQLDLFLAIYRTYRKQGAFR